VSIAVKGDTKLERGGRSRASTCFVGAPTQLNLVLVNLLSNAAKFTTEGTIELSVAVE
jgi:signal transduction histidine kinase